MVIYSPSAEVPMGQHVSHEYFALYNLMHSYSPPLLAWTGHSFQAQQCTGTDAGLFMFLWAEAIAEPPVAAALCKHLSAGTGDEQVGRPSSVPERLWLFPFNNIWQKACLHGIRG